MPQPMVPGRAAATGAVGTVVEKAPPTIDSHGGKLICAADCGPFGGGALASVAVAAILLTSPVSALLYGFVFSARQPSPFRTAIKTLAVGVLALFAAVTMAGGQMDNSEGLFGQMGIILAAGFALCALGDAFLAGDPKRWLAPGLAAFLLGHICFIALFGRALAVAGLPPIGPAIWAGMALIVLAGGAMLVWLWGNLGSLRWPVVAYVVVIVTMTCTGLIDAAGRPAWAIGGLMFMASDAILAVQLFKQRELLVSARLNGWAIWFLYYAAQVAFLIGAFQ